MKPRSTSVEILYNGVNITEIITPYITDFGYNDPAGGEADSISISLHSRDGRWLEDLMPQKGDSLRAVILMSEGEDTQKFDCGKFTLDSFSFGGWPVTASISGVSAPADTNFREAKRSQTWENVTLLEIGKEIAGRAGISLEWDGGNEIFTLGSIEQSEQTDSEFFNSLCDRYGLTMKVYSDKLVVFDGQKYREKSSVGTLKRENMLSWSWSTELEGSYTGGEFAYTDPQTEEDISVSIGSGERTLKMSGKADSKADAERQLRAGFNKANNGATKLSVTLAGGKIFAAGQTVDVEDLGKLSGKYYIESVSHRVGSSGYELELEMSPADSSTGSGSSGGGGGKGTYFASSVIERVVL